MSKKSTVVLVVCLIAYVIIYSLQDESAKKIEAENIKASKGVLKPITDAIGNIVKTGIENSENALGATEKIIDEKEANDQFEEWFDHESNNIEATVSDPEDLAKSLKEKAKSLTTQQIDYLAQKSHDPKAEASSQIFATYMLSLAGEKALGQLVNRAIQNDVPAEADTLDEVKATQIKAEGIIAIDGIFQSDADIPTRLEKLIQVINQTKVPALRDYAQKRKQELESQLN